MVAKRLKQSCYSESLMVAAVLGIAATFHAPDCAAAEWRKVRSPNAGGDLTVTVTSSEAYAIPAPNLSPERLEKHLAGDLDFEAKFVTAPAPVNPGLGPHFNNVSCINCHARDGRGRPDKIGTALSSLFLRVSLPGTTPQGGPVPVPGIGTQIADRANYGKQAEAEIDVTYEEFEVSLKGGEVVSLRKPTYHIRNPHTPLPDDIMVSARVAPPVFGRGLLEAITEEDILALADPDDQNGDGISGKPNYVWNPVTQRTELGRFGLKANNPTLLLQSASAYLDDMGVVAPVFATRPSKERLATPQTANYQETFLDSEITPKTLENVTFYVQTLGVPARRNLDDPAVIAGEEIFHQLQCNSCHTPSFTTGELAGVPEVSHQKIQPFTDMLLHDMGSGLADNRPDFQATGYEWRTPPLWGIGLTRIVSGHTFLLHDGRARNLQEAILWHGGEAEQSKEGFRQLPAEQRQALITFLESL